MINSFILVEMTDKQAAVSVLIGLFLIIVIDIINYFIDKKWGERMEIKVVLKDGAFMPEKAHKEDAGFDFRTPIGFSIEPGKSFVVDTGICLEIPEHYAGVLISKSGLNVKHGLLSTGLIDAGYQGSITVKLYNHSDKTYEFKIGDKISQIVIIPIPEVELEKVEKFNTTTDRGNNGFGSSGK